MENPVLALIILMLVLFILWLFGSIFWMGVIEPVLMRRNFRQIFGHQPTYNPHLRKSMQARVVDPVLIQLAKDLYKHNREEARLLHQVKRHRIPSYAETESKLTQVRGTAKAYYQRLKGAREVAEHFNFQTKSYKEYLGLTSDEPQEEEV